MRRSLPLVLLLLLMLAASTFSAAEDATELPLFLKNPNLSPDGKLVAFDYKGDIWVAPTAGGEAKRLTVHLAWERRPYFSPDGKWILYSAAYYGNYDLFIMPANGGTPRRLTYAPGNDIPAGWSYDGKYVYFYSFRDNLYDVFRMPASGGTPSRLVAAQRDYAIGPAPSPDGKLFAFCYRSGYQEWNRQGFKSPFTADIYIADATAPATNFRRITNNWHQDFLPLWSPDGKTLYFVSDEDGVYNLYRTNLKWLGKNKKQITHFKGKGVRWYTVSMKTGEMVIERNHRLYRLDPVSGEASLIEITMYDPPKLQEQEFVDEKVKVTDFSVSPDGKKVAFITGDDVFVMAATGGYAKRLTDTPERELHLSWAPDSTHVIFNRIIDDVMTIVRLDVRDCKEEIVAKGDENKFTPFYTPDGKHIAYQLGYREIRMMNPDGTGDELVVKGVFSRRLLDDGRWFDFTRDGKWLVYLENDEAMRYWGKAKKMGSKEKPVVLTPLGGQNFPGDFTPDYAHFIFTNYLNGSQAVYVIDFVEDVKPEKSPIEKLEELLNPPKKPAKKPAAGEKKDEKGGKKDEKADKKEEKGEKKEGNGKEEKKAEKKKPAPGDKLDTRHLLDKVRKLVPSLPLPHYFLYLSKSGRTAFIMVMQGSNYNIYMVPVSKNDKRKPTPLTKTPGRKSGFEVDKAEKYAYYITDGAIYRMSVKGGPARKITPSTVRKRIDPRSMRKAVFHEILWTVKYGFYDPKLHGRDMDYLRAVYEPLVDKCDSEGSFLSLMDEFLGEFNASHFSITKDLPTVGIVQEKTPHIGFFYDAGLAEKGIIKITHLVEKTPAGKPGSGLKEGDYVLEIEGTKIGPGVNIYELVKNKLGEQVKLVVADSPDAEKTRTVYLDTVDINGFYQARLKEWVNVNRRYVEDKSGGRFGYVCVPTMMDPEYPEFVKEMSRYMSGFDGVVLDFRYNSGGRISHRIAEVLDDSPWLFSKMRGGRWVPEDIHRDFSFQKAVVGLFNYASFSNAEMMAAAFRLKKLGPTIGTPTAGGVIGTWPKELIFGYTLYLPRFEIMDVKGRNLELSPTEPDIFVDRDVADEMAGRFPQLDKAIEELKKEAHKNKTRLFPRGER